MTSRQTTSRSVWSARVFSAAFTLTELLVVIVILGILAATQLPALTRTRVPVKGIQCVQNLRQLTLAWTLYANENQDRVINNFGTSAQQATIADGTFQNWVNNIMAFNVGWVSDLDPMNTNTAYIRNGLLAQYVRRDVSVYRCPADNYLCSHQRAAGWTNRVRSVSMNACLGTPRPGWNRPYGDFYSQDIRQWYRTTDVSRPSWFWLLLDEAPDSINDGRAINDMSAYLHNNASIPTVWNDFPATRHDGASPLSFVDGHIEFRRWTTPAITPVKYVDWSPTVDTPGVQDITWFFQHTGILYVP